MNLFSSLTNRIFFGTALAVALSIGVAVYRVNRAVTAQAEQDLAGGLREAAALVDDFVHARSARFVGEARLIVVQPPLVNAVATGDPPTVEGVARDYSALIAPDLFLVADTADRVLARTGRLPVSLVSSDAIIGARPHEHETTWFWPYEGGVLQVAAIPIATDRAPLGTLIIGFTLDQPAVEGIKARSNADIALVAGARVVAGTLGAARMSGLSGYASQTGSFRAVIGGDDYLGLVQPLDIREPARGSPVALVLRSRTERLRFLGQIQRDIALAGLVAVGVAILVGYAIARTVTRPLRAVTQTMGAMAATGNLSQATPAPGRWDDEDARLLASTFHRLTSALDKFQREAAQRERLSTLGRLSTVIAHEVRNPLMIIKSVVRELRKRVAEAAPAADSIDEEVGRINRVVSDVLDFARPIRFDYAPTDLVTLCRDAAAAASANTDGPAVTVDAADASLVTVTDAERLRSVLVNLLSNAQQAVKARGTDAGPMPIRVRTGRLGDGRVWLTVSDSGAGIAAEDLPRLFEPFFTTRRTGLGVGLALARNIIEGMGGLISVESAVNAGTTVRIELPPRTAVEATA